MHSDATPLHGAATGHAPPAMPVEGDSSPFLLAGTRLHEYRIERVLGHGGFGITYLARDTQLDKPMAIKEYLPADLAFRSGTDVSLRSPAEQEAFHWGLRQFLKEAQTLARFSHVNLVPVYRFFEANQTAYIVMGYAEGETLGGVLKREQGLSEDRLRRVLLPVMDGLEAVHRDGILHRDIKPDNIILRPDGSPVLIDFGAARCNLGAATSTAFCAISPGYAPLEQYGESSCQGAWTDIYALGALAYRALSGRKPPEALSRIHNDPLVPAKSIGSGRYSAAFLTAVDWALTMDSAQRPRTIPEWRRALDGGETRRRRVTEPARRAAEHAPQVLRLRTWAGWSAAAGAVLSLGLALQPATRERPQEPLPVASAQKALQMDLGLAKPPSPRSRSSGAVARAPEATPDPRVAALDEKRPIHRRQ